MEIEHDTLQTILKGLKDGSGDLPPAHVAWAMASLLGEGAPDALGGRRQNLEGGGSVWHAIAVSAERVVTVVATSPAPAWNIATMSSDGRRLKPEVLDARARRLKDVSSVDVIESISGAAARDADISRWSVVWRVNFADGGDPFEIHPDADFGGRSEGIARMLLASL